MMCRIFRKKRKEQAANSTAVVVSEPIQQQVITAVEYQRAMTLNKDVEGDIIIPKLPNSIHRPSFSIDGNGHVLRGFIRKEVGSQDEADQAIESRVFIRNVNFDGGGIILHATNGSKIEGCAFQDSVLDMRFCMHALVEGAHFRGNSYHIIADGNWKGANPANSQSNSTVVKQSRHFCSPGQKYAVLVKDSSQVLLTNCTYEGHNPIFNVVGEFVNGTNAQSFYIDMPHIENNPTIAAVDIAARGGLYQITRVWNQTCERLLRVNERSMPWFKIEISAPSFPARSFHKKAPMIEMSGNSHKHGSVKIICPFYASAEAGFFESLFANNKIPHGEVVN